jgi:hypothetical protein
VSADETRASLLELITARESAASTAAEQLRQQITALTEQLTAVETELTELSITRKTLLRLAGQPEPTTTDATVASPAYQQILAVFATAAGGLRAKDVCLALGVGTTAKDTEGLRAKLKRLVTRQILLETEPGLFALAPTTSPAQPD